MPIVEGAGTAGSPSTRVLTVQGIASGTNQPMQLTNSSGTEIGTATTPVRTDPTGTTTQPVSGTVTANAGTGTRATAGDTAHGAADAGNPVKVGGKASTSLPTVVANAQRVNTYLNEYGEPQVIAGGRVTAVATTPTISLPAYTAGDAIGGRIDMANATRKSGGSGVIQSIVLIDNDQEQREIDVVFFNQAFTATADNAVFAPSDADMGNCIGHVKITAGDYVNFSTNAVATVRNVGLAFVLSGSSTLYAQMVVRAAPVFTATNDLTLRVVVLQD